MKVLRPAASLGLLFAACSVSSCGGTLPAASGPRASQLAIRAVPACDARRDGWSKEGVYRQGDRLFGVGLGESVAAGQGGAQQAMTQWLGVRISSKSVDWAASSGGRDESRYQSSAESYASHSLSACKVERSCGDGEQIATLVSCTQGSGFERHLAELGRELGPKLPNGKLLMLPGVNEEQYVTRLGELALTVLRPALEEGKSLGTTLVTPATLRLSNLREVLRAQGASHWLALDLHLLGTDRLQLVATVRDALTDLEVPGAHGSRTFDLEAELLSLNDARGPLFAQRLGADLAGLDGGLAGGVTVTVPARLDEGKSTSFEIHARESGYVTAYVIDETGGLTRLVPSPLAPDNRIAGGASLTVPSAAAARAGYMLLPCAPPGQPVAREQLKVVWSKAPIAGLPGQASGASGGYVVLDPGASGDQRKLVATLEGLRSQGISFATALATYVIEGSPEGARRCAGR